MMPIIQTEGEKAEAVELITISCIDLRSALMIKRFNAGHEEATAILSGGALDQDETFYRERLVQPVRGRGIYRTVQTRIVGRTDLDHLPYFLCGGGSRLSLYKNISLALDGAPEFRRLRAHRKELGVPSELEAKGLAQIDYDRLSVAYGLSFVDVGNVAFAKAMPAIKQTSSVEWQSRYTGKDIC